MSENSSADTWQVDVNGQVYETNFDEMTQWIAEGALLRGDKVRKGSLRWIEAGRVPTLHNFFNAKESGNPIYPVVSTTVEEPQQPEIQAPAENFAPNAGSPGLSQIHNSFDHQPPQNFTPPPSSQPRSNTDGCVTHPDVPPAYLCETCGSSMCRACPNSYGGSVKICPFCGAMCKSIEDVAKTQQQTAQFDHAMEEGFGLADFGRALAYPFKFKFSLIVGAIMFAFASYGRSASSMGGMMLIASAIFCGMAANTLTFGILANTVENFSQGRIGENFMPSFDGFSIWEDVVHPFFLSVAVYLVSFGLFAVLVLGTIWYFVNSVTSMTTELPDKSINAVMPGSQADLNSARQVPQINKLREQLNKNNQYADGQMPDEEEIIQNQSFGGVRDTEDDVMRAQEMIKQHQKAQAESVVGKLPEDEDAMYGEMVRDLLGKAALLVIPIALSLLWGLFYFPAACAVAGYTQSFTATLNPTVGLDTIKRLGFSYVKILLMGLTILIISGIIGGVLQAIFSPFDLPKVGNIPAGVIGSFITFYFSIVFSCVLGFAIYKNSHKLKLFQS